MTAKHVEARLVLNQFKVLCKRGARNDCIGKVCNNQVERIGCIPVVRAGGELDIAAAFVALDCTCLLYTSPPAGDTSDDPPNGSSEIPEDSDTTNVPLTGDTSNRGLWLMLFLLSGAGFAGLMVYGNYKKKSTKP